MGRDSNANRRGAIAMQQRFVRRDRGRDCLREASCSIEFTVSNCIGGFVCIADRKRNRSRKLIRVRDKYQSAHGTRWKCKYPRTPRVNILLVNRSALLGAGVLRKRRRNRNSFRVFCTVRGLRSWYYINGIQCDFLERVGFDCFAVTDIVEVDVNCCWL